MYYGAHLHTTLEIIWNRCDRSELVVGDRRFRLGRGDIMIIAPNVIHGGGSVGSEPFSFASLLVPAEIVEDFTATHGKGSSGTLPIPIIQLIGSRYAGPMYESLAQSLPATTSPQEERQCVTDLLNRLLKLARWGRVVENPERNDHPAIRYVQSRINTAFTDKINLGRLAGEVDMNQRYLNSLFKSETGIPPHQYQIALRVELGRRLLSSNMTLCQIASCAGFSDQSHFTRHFKRVYGVAPGVFRNAFSPY